MTPQTSEYFLFFSFPQEIHHSRRQIKYSKDKMWYLAKMVRPTAEIHLVSVEFLSSISMNCINQSIHPLKILKAADLSFHVL